MAPPRKHDTDLILDAARALVLRDGPRAAGVAAIAAESGAPVGTLYHRFGSRDGVLAAVWLRALERFQARCLDAAATAHDAREAGVAELVTIGTGMEQSRSLRDLAARLGVWCTVGVHPNSVADAAAGAGRLHDDLLTGLEQLGDALALRAAATPAARDLDSRERDVVGVQEAVFVKPDVDERRLEPGQDVVDLALVDVSDDRARSAALDVELSDACV